jgi:tripartite-type tricarboxylate transporter receptor subunit TctC
MQGILSRILVVLAAILAATASAFSQPAYPSRPVTIVVGFPPGAAQDLVARALARKLGEKLGQAFIIDNRPGAAGTTAVAFVSRAAPDGYTLSMGSLGANVVTPLAKRGGLGYDPHTAFTPIAALTSQPLVLIVAESGPYKTLADLIAAGRKREGKLNYASAGIGSLSHFATEQFNTALGTDFIHIPYQGSAPALRALLAGEVAMYFAAATDAVPRLKGGAVRGLLVSLPERFAPAGDTPSLNDAKLKDPVMDQWFGLLGPAGVPRDIVLKLNEAVQEGLKDPALQQSIAGATVKFGSAEDFAAMLKSDLARVAQKIQETKFKAE